jgi:hypothetical protein
LGESLKALFQGAGEAAGAAMVCAHCRSAARAANLIIPGFGNSSHDFVVDTPVKEVLFVYELTGEPQDEEMASRLEEHKKSTSWSLAFP